MVNYNCGQFLQLVVPRQSPRDTGRGGSREQAYQQKRVMEAAKSCCFCYMNRHIDDVPVG